MATPEQSNRGQLPGIVSREFDQQAPQFVSDPKDIPWALSHFSQSGAMTWAVREGDLREFWIIERSPLEVEVNVRIVAGTIGGTVGQLLYVRLPFARVAAHGSGTLGIGFDNAAFTPIAVYTEPGEDRIRIARSDFANWTAGTMSAQFQITVRTVAQR